MNLQMEINKINERLDAITLDTQLLIDELKEVMENEFPQEDDDYWFIDAEGRVNFTEYGINDYDIDDERLSIGNVFETKEQAEFAVEKLKVEAELRKFSIPFKRDTLNFIMCFDTDEDKICRETKRLMVQGAFYFENIYQLDKAIESVGADRIKKYIFGVED